jgi:hypothetical protein
VPLLSPSITKRRNPTLRTPALPKGRKVERHYTTLLDSYDTAASNFPSRAKFGIWRAIPLGASVLDLLPQLIVKPATPAPDAVTLSLITKNLVPEATTPPPIGI